MKNCELCASYCVLLGGCVCICYSCNYKTSKNFAKIKNKYYSFFSFIFNGDMVDFQL
jgi:hypothetical protein